MKLISWNVNGLRAIAGKGFAEIFNALDAECVCLQETKIQPGQIELEFEGYTSYFDCADRKGYSGTATWARGKEKPSRRGIGIDRHDHEGRTVTVDLGPAYLVNVYVPNSQSELARLDYRLDWEKSFAEYVKSLDREKPVIICGDMNVAHKEIDLKNPKANRRNPGFTDEEREAFGRLLECGFVDTFRQLHPDVTDAYSWWSYRFNSRAKNIGWRIDYFLVSERIADRIRSADILSDITGSDHCPVSIEIEL